MAAEFEERRKTLRAPCCYPVHYAGSDGSELKANVIDLGYGGMRVLVDRSLPVGQTLSVTPADGGRPVSVKVVWTHPAGAEFESGTVYLGPLPELNKSWVKNALRGLGFEGDRVYERRSYVRWRTEMTGQLKVGDQLCPVSVCDVSLGGALLESEEPVPDLAAGTEVSLQLRLEGLDEPLNAGVVYQRHELIGLAFKEDRATRSATRLLEGYLRSMA